MYRIFAMLILVPPMMLGQTAATSAVSVPEPAPPRVLTSNARISFDIPMFGATGKVLCDASGNLYFNVSNMLPTALNELGPYLKIQADGRRHQVFAPHTEAQQNSSASEGVSPDGTFYILLQTPTKYELQRFKEDGSYDRSTRLDLPSGLSITHWAIQNNGVAYVSGYFESSDTDSHTANGYAALVDPSGKLIANLSETSSPVHFKTGPALPQEGDVAASTNGRFYILTSNKIVVVTQVGQVEDAFSLAKPNPDALAVRIDASGGMISVVFHTLTGSKGMPQKVEASAVLLNAATGESIYTIAFADSLTNSVLCFQSDEGYSLMAVEKQMAAKDVVPIR